ncbi:hypothetical protein MNBD_GAMMA23-471 [hydrothermal vent metagenome]|uniref:HTH tetR-type domain-containing protein n=1 Tax=hydrothermal vent metagenome TaxID=652676 RepID=A0A3B1AA85_9ZZZZ
MKNSDLKRIEIIETAERRFLDIGYNKTTMAEIADDLGMSAANLYRFFKSKQDIAAACAERCLGKRGDCLKEVVAKSELSAGEKLLAFVLEDIRYTFESENEPKVNELIAIVTREHKDIVLSKLDSQCELIAEIIEQGNASGEFNVTDVPKTASAIYSSLTLFEIPIFLPLFTKEQFEKMASDLVELLLTGLKKR